MLATPVSTPGVFYDIGRSGQLAVEGEREQVRKENEGESKASTGLIEQAEGFEGLAASVEFALEAEEKGFVGKDLVFNDEVVDRVLALHGVDHASFFGLFALFCA